MYAAIFSLVVLCVQLQLSSQSEITLEHYYLPTSDVLFNGGTLESDCHTPTTMDDLLRLCPIPSRLADNVTEERQEFDSNSFVRFRGDFELVFQFPDTHISLVDIYFYNNPKMGYGLPPVTEAGFSFNNLVTFNAIQVSFANNSHLSQSDDSVTVVSIVVSSDPDDNPYSFLRLSFDNSSTQLSETYISEVKLFNGTGFIPKFTEIQFSRPNQTVYEYGHNNDIVSSVELSCTVAVEGSFSITWTGPNGTITESGDKIKIYSADTTRTSILRITQLSLMDNGTYSCEASYSHSLSFDVGSATNTISLILGGTVSHPNTVQAQVDDKSVTLQCNFTGYLPSTINVIWRNNEGVEIEDANDGYNITTILSGPGVSQRGGDSVESGITSTLTITNIKNGTEYTCIMEGTSIQGTIQLIGDQLPPYSSSTSSTSTASFFTFSSSPSSFSTLPSSSSSNELLVVILSSSIVVGIVLLTVSVLTVILTMLVCYRKKRSSNISLKDLTMNQSYGVVADSACYVDIDAKIQKETEAMFSDSVIDKSRLDLIEKLGEGEFRVVYRGKLTGQSNNIPTAVAVKTLKGSVDPSKADSIINEALKMKSFNHLNILPLIGICLDPIEAPCIVMPFMNEGSLLSYLRREKHNLIVSAMAEEKTISETAKKLLSMCVQVANGMAYLADKKFVHRDLAARNCMISSDGIIKVADFGLSEDIYESEYFKQPKESKEKVKLPLKWMAPESMHYRTFNEKTDIWSYGVVCWEVFTSGMSPYSSMSPKDVLDALNAGQRLDKPSNAACSEEIYSLMLVCWSESASKRPCFHEIVNKLEHLIAPLSEYMDFTELYVTIRIRNEK